ncbi:hypothetical protein HPB50_002319 [Hyalomma asiaticum]|uniref:Uncharacterized protein n=1 Tax=Hyalomma asiaticum TaxID=266040 RepID=A0ACB7RXK8_HYAAI|nr:hypothetical protein HPB50_002319 [Hyalomma asiaticum]
MAAPSMPPQPLSSGPPPPSIACNIPVITLTSPPDSGSPMVQPSMAVMTAACQVSEEQEAARSLLHLSAHVPEGAAWPSDAGPAVPPTSRTSPISVAASTGPMVGPSTFVGGAGPSGNPGTSSELTVPEAGSWPQGGLPWLSSPPAGHRPRSFSMEMHERAAGIAEAEPTRRYSMSSLGRHPEDGPMDLSTARQRRLEILPGGYVSGHNVRSYAREGGLLGACLELGGPGSAGIPTHPQGAPMGAPSSESIGTSTSGSEEGRCGICHKSFTKASQLRMHVNIHYFERPFRCEACAVSFRTRGHLQKHRRSVGHFNRLNMNLAFGAPSADNPRPFKCADCQIAFRIHGHLAKHLRSKMHILKLECLGKLPFGMYAEMERSGVNLNEIDTSDCDNSLESLQVMAQKLYQHGEPSLASPVGVSDPVSPLRAGGGSPPPVIEAPPPPSWESGALRPCHLCGRLLKSAKSLQVHLHCDHPPGAGLQQADDEVAAITQVHSPPLATPWLCSICQKAFPSQALLQQHFVSHTQPRPYVCDQCDAGFTSALLLANHVANSHPTAPDSNILPPRVPLVQSPVLSTV